MRNRRAGNRDNGILEDSGKADDAVSPEIWAQYNESLNQVLTDQYSLIRSLYSESALRTLRAREREQCDQSDACVALERQRWIHHWINSR